MSSSSLRSSESSDGYEEAGEGSDESLDTSSSFQAQLTQSLTQVLDHGSAAGAAVGNHPNETLELNFQDWYIRASDVQDMARTLEETFAKLPEAQRPPLDLSWAGCRLASPEARSELHDCLTQVTVGHLNLSLADFSAHEMIRLVAAADPQRLTLTLRYPEGFLPPLLQAASPRRLRSLQLNAKQAHQHRVRLVCLQELVTALIDAGHAQAQDSHRESDPATSSNSNNDDDDDGKGKGKDKDSPPSSSSSSQPAITSPLQNLQSFSLTDCEMNQEGLNLLVGGLLSLRNTLHTLHLQFDGHDVGASESSLLLQPLSVLMGELPLLQDFVLGVSDCTKLFQPPGGEAVEGRELEDSAASPASSTTSSPEQLEHHNAMIQQFCQALQKCQAQSIRLSLSNVGLTEEAVLQVLEAVAQNRRSTTTGDNDDDDNNNDEGTISLQIRDFFFIQTERFLYQLVTWLPHCQRVQELSLIDMAKYHVNFLCWWTDENEDLLVEALDRNTSLEAFDFQVGSVHTHVLSPENMERVQVLLQRNCENHGRPATTL